MDDLSQFQNLFLDSANDHLEKLQIDLEKSLHDDNTAVMEDIHLRFHTLKGEALAMQYSLLGNYLTVLERYLKKMNSQNQRIPSDKLHIIKQAVSKVKIVLEEIKSYKKEPANLAEKVQLLVKELEVEP